MVSRFVLFISFYLIMSAILNEVVSHRNSFLCKIIISKISDERKNASQIKKHPTFQSLKSN